MTGRKRFKLAFALRASVAFCLGVMPAGLALAQSEGGLFAPRIVINGQIVTNYEFEQRVKFLSALRVPGDPEKEATEGLTTDRLGAQEAKRLEIKLTDSQIEDGMREFAGRANLDVPAFVKAIGEEGVEAETFRDFVSAGLLWREVVRKKFGNAVRISEVQVDRAMAEAARKPDVRLLLSELVVPVPQGADPSDVLAEVRDLKENIAAEGGFASAARKYSAAPTAERGGRLDWLTLSNLPPAITDELIGLSQGEVSDPIVVPQAVVLFQLNGLSDLETPQPTEVKVSYAQFSLAPEEEAATVLSQADGCGDLYPMARDLPAERLKVTDETPMASVPQDIGLALAKLDPGEAVLRERDGYREILMLCLRNGVMAEPEAGPAEPQAGDDAAAGGTQAEADAPKPEEGAAGEGEQVKRDPLRETVRGQLGNRQIAALADAYMEELRSEAIIETP